MNHETTVAPRRNSLLQSIFPAGIPSLWCPALTHYSPDGAIDRERIAAHLRHLSPHVKGLLIPGSTGDAWELSDNEVCELLEIVLPEVKKQGLHLLIGALKPDAGNTLQAIREAIHRIAEYTGEPDTTKALAKANVSGFTICPPRGRKLTQTQIADALSTILETGLPIAIYQLPQVTQNEMGPELVAGLAARYPNFIMFKDTSGADRVAMSGLDLGGVFALRGSEGDYARWLNTAGGPYGGFLLSAANCFASELHQIIDDISAQRLDAARQMSARLTSAVGDVFTLVSGLPDGNPFANANKAMDHFFAHGPGAATGPPPRLHAGSFLPAEVIRRAGEILLRERLMREKGYL